MMGMEVIACRFNEVENNNISQGCMGMELVAGRSAIQIGEHNIYSSFKK